MSSKEKACVGRVAAWATPANKRTMDQQALMAPDITQVLVCRREQERSPGADGSLGGSAGARRGAGALRSAGAERPARAPHLRAQRREGGARHQRGRGES